MAIHFSILDWKIPRTEKPGGLESMGSQRVEHNWVCTHILPPKLRPPKQEGTSLMKLPSPMSVGKLYFKVLEPLMLLQIDVKCNQVKTLKCSYITSSHECLPFIEGVWISLAVAIVLVIGSFCFKQKYCNYEISKTAPPKKVDILFCWWCHLGLTFQRIVTMSSCTLKQITQFTVLQRTMLKCNKNILMILSQRECCSSIFFLLFQ